MPPLRRAPWLVVVSCEHASNHVPSPYRPLFRGAQRVLRSHRGWDPGALELAHIIARRFHVSVHRTQVTRLLIEPNRSLHHPHLFSEFTSTLPHTAREQLIKRYYLPHRQRVEHAIRIAMDQGYRVFHCSAHTFTPQLNGVERNADIGLLYDPRHGLEQRWCRKWQQNLLASGPWRVRRNYPYRGASDGLTTHLRRQFPWTRYLGVELELNQRWVSLPGWHKLCTAAAEGLYGVIDAARIATQHGPEST